MKAASAQALWAHHVATEYRSAMVATELLHWLMRLGCSPDTLARCHRIAADELRHAELAFEMFQLAGGTTPAPVPEEWTTITREPEADLLHRALAVVTAEYALSETVAAALFRRLRREPLRPEVGAVIGRIARDEASHSAFAWFALEELLPRAPGAAAWVAARVPGWTEELRAQFTRIAPTCTDEERAWGRMEAAGYHACIERTFTRIVWPRMAGLGIHPIPGALRQSAPA